MRSHFLRAAGADQYFFDVSLLLNFNGTNGSTTFTDSSSSPKTATVFGNSQISTAQSKFGGSSLLLDGNADYLTFASSPDFALSGDFTIETWIYPTSLQDWDGIFSVGSFTNNYLTFRLAANGNLEAWLNGFGNRFVGGTVSTNTWSHVALVRFGTGTNNVKIYLNGVSVAQTTSTYSVPQALVCIGRSYPDATTEYFNGYVDSFRLTKGIARYITNFTPPNQQFFGA